MVRAAFLAMESIGWFVIVPLSLAALPTGLVQSLGTEWGLFRHCWMLAKFLYLDDTLTETDATALVALVAEPSLAARFLEATRLNSEVAGLLAAPVPDATMVEFVRADIEKSLVGTQIADGVRLRIAERAQPPAATQPSFLPSRTRPRRRKPALRALAWAAVFLILAALAGIYLSEGWRPA